jgi:hypothetical protein
MKKQMTLTELSAAINVEEHARASNKPSQQLQAHVVEKGGDRKFHKKKKNSPQKNLNQHMSKKMNKKKRILSATFVVSPSIQLGGANLGREKVLHLSANKGTWWLTPPQGMHLRPLWQVHHMTGGWIPVLLFIFVLIDTCSLLSRDTTVHQS